MKRITLVCLVLFLLQNSSIAQHQPYSYQLYVQYELTDQPDSTNSNSIVNEFETLLVGKEQSLFCATQYLVMDSAITSEAAKGNKFGPSMSFFQTQGTHNATVIFKTNTDVIVYDKAATFVPTLYQYKEDKPLFEWEILKDTALIDNIPCQKAQTSFGNRLWIAWFAPDIPVSDGPYKFCGLPGLIIKIADAQNFWNFNLTSLKQFDTTLSVSFMNKVPVLLKSKEEFFRQKKYARDNHFEVMKLNGWNFSNSALAIKQYEQLAKKDNNWIELYKGN